MVTIRLSAADINGFLAASPEAEVRYDLGTFTVAKSFGALLRIRARAHLDLRGGHVRLAIPFSELGTEHTGRLLGGVTALLWPKWLEPWIEKKVGDTLATHGLPWDLLWLDTIDDPELGRIGTVNFSPRTLNEWLRRQPVPGDLVPRLVAIRVEDEALAVGLELVSRTESAPAWQGAVEPVVTVEGPPTAREGHVAPEPESQIQIDPVAINTLLQHFVSGRQGLLAQFVDGRLEIVHNGLAITVYGVALTATGLDVRLRFGQAPPPVGVDPETTA